MSMERGFVHWHGDVDCTDRALEAGLGFACKKVEDYLGRAAVEEMRSKGVTRETEIKRILFLTNSSAEYSANYSVKLFGQIIRSLSKLAIFRFKHQYSAILPNI